MPPKLDLSALKALTKAIESRDVAALTAPLLEDPFSFFSLFPHIVSQLLLQALSNPSSIDDLVHLVLTSATKLQQAHPEHFNQVREPSYFSAGLPDVQGLGKGLVTMLVSELHTALLPQVQRAVSPPQDGDGLLSSAYYHRALSHGLFISRLFAVASPSEEEVLHVKSASWTVLEDVLRKGPLSPPVATGGHPEPGSLLVSAIILHSSGLSLSKYLHPNGSVKGKGLNYVWYDDKLNLPEEEWGWDQVVEKASGGIDQEGNLKPKELGAYVEERGKEVARSPTDATSEDVVKRFSWIENVPLRTSRRDRRTKRQTSRNSTPTP